MSGSNTIMETSAPLVNGIANNAVFQSSLHIDQTLLQITHILHFSLVDSLRNYTANFAITWIEAMAVRQPQIWRDESMTVGFTQLLRMASLQTLQTILCDTIV